MSTVPSTPRLPLPLLVFDGDCAFCTSSVDRLERLLRRFPEKSPWQWLELGDYGLSVHDVETYAWVVSAEKRYPGHLALSALLRMQSSALLRFVGHLVATPPFSLAAAGAYWAIAHNRHRLPGGTPACALPSAERGVDAAPEAEHSGARLPEGGR